MLLLFVFYNCFIYCVSELKKLGNNGSSRHEPMLVYTYYLLLVFQKCMQINLKLLHVNNYIGMHNFVLFLCKIVMYHIFYKRVLVLTIDWVVCVVFSTNDDVIDNLSCVSKPIFKRNLSYLSNYRTSQTVSETNFKYLKKKGFINELCNQFLFIYTC